MSGFSPEQLIDFTYLVAAVLFVLSLKWLSSPKTAGHGVLAGEIGAALAVGATLFNPELVEYKWIVIALIVGAGVGIPLGMVHMTAVPQRTALSHAFGALSATMIGIAEYYVQAPNVAGERHGRLVLGDPSGDALTQVQADGADLGVVGQLGCAQYDVSGFMIRQIDQTGIAGRHLYRDGDELLQHIIDRKTGADDSACAMQDGNLPCGCVVFGSVHILLTTLRRPHAGFSWY